MTGEWARDWNNFIDTLSWAHISLGLLEDDLVWGKNVVGGNYYAKLGYETLIGPWINEVNRW